jgi:chemotaxis methyl-accepting protein methylase
MVIKNIFDQNILKKICTDEKHYFFDENENLLSLKNEIYKRINHPNINYKQITELGEFDLIFTRKIFFNLSNDEIFDILKLFKKCLVNEGIIILSEIEDITEIDREIYSREFNGRRYFIYLRGN